MKCELKDLEAGLRGGEGDRSIRGGGRRGGGGGGEICGEMSKFGGFK